MVIEDLQKLAGASSCRSGANSAARHMERSVEYAKKTLTSEFAGARESLSHVRVIQPTRQ